MDLDYELNKLYQQREDLERDLRLAKTVADEAQIYMMLENVQDWITELEIQSLGA